MSKYHQIYKRLAEDYNRILAMWSEVKEVNRDLEQVKDEMLKSQLFHNDKDGVVPDKMIQTSLYKASSSMKKWNASLTKYIKENDQIDKPLSSAISNIILINHSLVRCQQDSELLIDSFGLYIFQKQIEKNNPNYIEDIAKTDPELEKFLYFKKSTDSQNGSFDQSTNDSGSLHTSLLSDSEEINKNPHYESQELSLKFNSKNIVTENPDKNKIALETTVTKTENDKQSDVDIFQAVIEGNIDTVKRLLEAGIDVDTKDEYQATLLYKAALYSHKEIVKILLEYKADPNISCRAGLTALHMAAENGNKEILELLVEKNGKVDLLSDNKNSLMHSAAIGIKDGKNNWDVIKWLLDHKVDPFIENDIHKSPRDILDSYDWSYAEKYDVFLNFSDAILTLAMI